MFGNPDNYTKVLNHIGIFSFLGIIASAALLFMLGGQDVPRGPTIEVSLLVLKFPMPIPWAVFALAASIFFRIIKLHDRISDIGGIRKKYDIQYIIMPVFRAVFPGDAAPPRESVLVDRRRALMRAIFYKYAPGVPGKNIISDHLVAMAWESLCWFWVLTELACIALIFAVVSLAFCVMSAFFAFLAIFCLLLLVCFVSHCECIKQTAGEVEAILEDAARRDEIKRAFDDILR